MNSRIVKIAEQAGKGRLGRHVEHDERSKAFGVAHTAINSVQHKRHCPAYDQGALGSCTGNAMAGALMTGPLYLVGRELQESDAIALYSMATKLDKVPGHYPPEDTGSSGLAVAKAAKKLGWVQSYRHAFGLRSALAALTSGPVIIGINWYESFDEPQGSSAELVLDGATIRGGHEVVLDGLDVEHGFVHGTNSWGPTWGNNGGFVLSFGTLKRLLAENGDVVALH